jgi:excisionase family DNA binding protein
MLVGLFDMTEKQHEWQAGDLLSVAQAADYLDISRQRVNVLIAQDRLPGAYKIGEFWVIPFEAIENFEPRKGGRPPKKSPN